MNLELYLKSDDSSLAAAGEIYPDPLPDDARPIVNMVVARNTYSALFSLSPGRYGYYFHVEGGGGAFEISLVRADTQDQVSKPDQFDTKYGYYGKVYLFAVPE
jgi:hypothetical protein